MKNEMRTVARAKVSKALDDVTVAVYTSARETNAEAVHKLRVSIRRFLQAMRVFRQYLPDGVEQRIRGPLRDLMKAAGEVRDRDILILLLEKEGLPAGELDAGRDAARKVLAEKSRVLQDEGMPRRWRRRLLQQKENSAVER